MSLLYVARERDEARNEVERLRGVLNEACGLLDDWDGILVNEFGGNYDSNGDIARLRREGGLAE